MTAVPSKSDLRLAAVRVRAQIADNAAAAKAVGHYFVAEFPLDIHEGKAPRVAGYWPINDELDDRSLLNDLHGMGVHCLLPVVAGKDQPLVFRAWRPGLKLATSDWGIGEPGPDQPAAAPDIVLLPLLAFDDRGWRLGYGGGYYDRSLAALRGRNPGRVLAVGLAYARQRVDTVPHNDFDQRLDYVVTEDGVIKFRAENNR